MRSVWSASWVAIPMALIVASANAQDAIYQSNEARTGELEKLDLHEQPKVLWKFEPEAVNGNTPDLGGVLAAGERLFFSDRGGRIYAARAADGRVLWTRQVARGRSAAPLVMGDVAYFATSTQVLALSAIDGTTVWEFAIPDGANETSPLMVEHLLLVCGYDGVIHALDAQLGTEEWTRDVVVDAPPDPPGFDGQRARFGDKPARPKIAASDGKTLFQPIFDQSRVLAIDCLTGKDRWSFQTGGWIYGHPAVAQGRVYSGSQDKKFYCLEKNTGKVVWSFETKRRIEAGPAVHAGSVYFGSCDGHVYRLDARTGERQWSFECDRYAGTGRTTSIYASPLVTDETVYVAAMEGQVYALRTADGRLRWKLRPSPGSEIAGNLATDGQRLFLTTRIDNGAGEQAVFAIGNE